MIAATIRRLVLPAMVMIAIAGCAGSGNSASDAVRNAKAYVRTIGPDAAQVQTYEIKVGLDILHNDPTGLAQDAQTAHDAFVNAKTDIIAAGANVADNSRLGNAEYQMDNAINELKNGMGALVAFAENPNAGTLGAANSKLGQGVTDWDQAATVLWTMAGQESELPTLAGSVPATTNSNAATTSATTPNPGSSSIPSWVQAARNGCPAGEVLSKTLSNGEPAPYGNDGCVGSASGECGTSEPTCDPANVPGGAPTTQTTTPVTTSTASTTTTGAVPPNPTGRCADVEFRSPYAGAIATARVAVLSGTVTCAVARALISASSSVKHPASGESWQWSVDGWLCSSGGDGTIDDCTRQGNEVEATTPTPGGYWAEP